MQTTYRIPTSIYAEVEQHRRDIERYLSGSLSEEMFRARRVPRGIYAQRNGEYMARVRVPGGMLWSSQLRHLARLGNEFAGMPFHFTTRQDVQFHEVRLENTYPLMKGLLEAGLTSLGGGGNTVRNITTCAHSGIHPAEAFDPLPYVLALTEYLLSRKSAYNLPRKFKIAFSCSEEDGALARINDLGFIARRRGEQKGFAVYTGGGMGAVSRPGILFRDFLAEEELVPVVNAVLNIFHRFADRRNRQRSRLRFVLEKLGRERFLAELEKELVRTKVEAQTVLNSTLQLKQQQQGKAPKAPAHKPNPSAAGIKYEDWLKTCTFPQRQRGFRGVFLPLKRGDMPVEDLQLLAGLCEQHAASYIRVHRRQNILIPFVPQEQLPDFFAGLEHLSIQNGSSEGEAWTVSCKGADTCKLGICRAQELNAAISKEVRDAGVPARLLAELELHTSGCPNNCGQHAIAPLGFYGAARRKNGHSYPAYNLVAEAQLGPGNLQLSSELGILPARNVPSFLVELLSDYYHWEYQDHNFPAYWQERGRSTAVSLLEKYAPVPSYEDAPEYYRDWGTEEVFSLEGRSAGECGAGVIELIAEEVKKSEKAYDRARRNAADASACSRHLLESAGLAAGALLVTKGIEPGDPDTSFREFERHFIDQNLVSEKHRNLLILARSALRGTPGLTKDNMEEVRALLDEVQRLYDRMDASLNFPVQEREERTEQAGQTERTNMVGVGKKRGKAEEKQKVGRELDLRGVPCPMNFVQAKIALEQLPVDSLLEVILDEGEPLKNVPHSFTEQGQEVVSVIPEGDRVHRVVIRKAK